MDELDRALSNLQPGEVVEPSGLDRLLAEHWTEFRGSDDGGMEGYKLLGRIERVRWQPPVLSFVVERHGGTVLGSTRAELQHWEIDVAERTARLVKVGHRQLESMAARTDVKELAAEIALRIVSGQDDDRIKWFEDRSVKIFVTKIFTTGSGFQRTVSGRRKRLIQYVAETLSKAGWKETTANVFKPPHT